MRYLVLLKGTPPAGPPPAELYGAIAKLGEDASKSGALLDTAGLVPSAAGARVQAVDGKVSATDGPFTEAKEMISYAIYDVRSKEEAVEWTSRFMNLHVDLWPGWEGESDILQVFEPGDFSPPA
jgi:hypothetical protein